MPEPDEKTMSAQTSYDRADSSITPASARHRREEERSLHLRTAFLRRVAHDIASPTGVTMTVIDELASSGGKPELVAMARRGLRRLMRLSEQLALTADIEAGGWEPEMAIEDARSVLKDAVDAAVAIDGRRDIQSSLSLPPERLATGVDRRVVVTALREIVGNALRIASSKVQIAIAKEGDAVVVRIHDDGPGFHEDALATLGERFVARNAMRGLGLSLAMAKDVLDAHGGTLSVEQSALPPGRRGTPGACVVVSLPCA